MIVRRHMEMMMMKRRRRTMTPTSSLVLKEVVVEGGGGGGPSKLRLANDVDLQELVPRLQMLVVLQLRLMRVATPAGA